MNLQFSLLGLVVVMTLAAMAFGVLFATPLSIAFSAVSFIDRCLPAMLTVLLVYSRGYLRTFCIGALFPAGFAMISSLNASAMMTTMSSYGGWAGGNSSFQEDDWRILQLINWGLIVVIGGLCMGMRFFLVLLYSGSDGRRDGKINPSVGAGSETPTNSETNS